MVKFSIKFGSFVRYGPKFSVFDRCVSNFCAFLAEFRARLAEDRRIKKGLLHLCMNALIRHAFGVTPSPEIGGRLSFVLRQIF